MEESSSISPQPTDQIVQPAQTEGKRFWPRAGAYAIDLLILYATNYAMSFLIGVVLGILLAILGRDFHFDEQASQCLSFGLGLTLSVLYFVFFEWLYGGTAGKLLLGMRVVEEGGGRCSIGAAFIRGLLRYVDGLLFGLPAYMNMKHPSYQRIGDKAGKTIVVSSKAPIIQDARPGWWFAIAAALYLIVDGLLLIVLFASGLRLA